MLGSYALLIRCNSVSHGTAHNIETVSYTRCSGPSDVQKQHLQIEKQVESLNTAQVQVGGMLSRIFPSFLTKSPLIPRATLYTVTKSTIMHLSTFFIIPLLQLCFGSVLQARAACNADNCARAVTGTSAGIAPAFTVRQSDCSSFQKTTVTPAPMYVLRKFSLIPSPINF